MPQYCNLSIPWACTMRNMSLATAGIATCSPMSFSLSLAMSSTSCRLAYSWPSDSFDTFAALSGRSKRYAASGVDGKADKAGVVCQTRKLKLIP